MYNISIILINFKALIFSKNINLEAIKAIEIFPNCAIVAHDLNYLIFMILLSIYA